MAKITPDQEGTTKASFNLRPTLLKQLKYIALMDDKTQTEILDATLSKFVADWEKKHGKVPLK